eukprot:1559025-Pleurochrysis_carterae.AAC.2
MEEALSLFDQAPPPPIRRCTSAPANTARARAARCTNTARLPRATLPRPCAAKLQRLWYPRAATATPPPSTPNPQHAVAPPTNAHTRPSTPPPFFPARVPSSRSDFQP